MRISQIILAAVSIATFQIAFANPMMMHESKSCRMVAKACLNAGYDRRDSAHKKFWFDCMKPVILGQNVKGVKLNEEVATACRTDKIAELKTELNELEHAG